MRYAFARWPKPEDPLLMKDDTQPDSEAKRSSFADAANGIPVADPPWNELSQTEVIDGGALAVANANVTEPPPSMDELIEGIDENPVRLPRVGARLAEPARRHLGSREDALVVVSTDPGRHAQAQNATVLSEPRAIETRRARSTVLFLCVMGACVVVLVGIVATLAARYVSASNAPSSRSAAASGSVVPSAVAPKVAPVPSIEVPAPALESKPEAAPPSPEPAGKKHRDRPHRSRRAEGLEKSVL